MAPKQKAWQSKSVPTLLNYNALDTVFTARIWAKMKAELDARTQTLYTLHLRQADLASRMGQRGFYVDEARRSALALQLDKLYDERLKELLDYVGVAGFLGTENQLRSLIYKRHETAEIKKFGLPDPVGHTMYTNEEMDECAVDRNALMQILISPLTPPELKRTIELYWMANAPWKLRSTYVESALVRQATYNGRLHASWNSCGTETMRWSCSGPNIQNLSEKKEASDLRGELPNVRSMYRAAPGYVLVHADYSQLELRVMEVVSGDTALKAALDTGDVYSFDARAWFNLAPDFDVKKLKPGLRKSCKIIHLASQYLAGTDTVHNQALQQDRTFKYAVTQALHKSWHKTYSQTVDFGHAQMEEVGRCGYSEGKLLFGRRNYPAQPPINEVINYPIQRTAGELMSLAMDEVDRRLRAEVPDAHIITQIHDAIDVECRPEAVDKVKVILEAMGTPRTVCGRTREFPVEIKVGTYWSEV